MGSPTRTANRQTRKRLATRQKISDIATRLFSERGFDEVRIDEIAEAADVSRMTVFNHFPRKEDLFFDLDAAGREEVLAALRTRDQRTSPVEALRLFAHGAVAQQRPYVRFYDPHSDRFMAVLQASDTLKARARTIRDELTTMLALALQGSAERKVPDPVTELAASMLVASWTIAFTEAHRLFQRNRDRDKANAALLAIIDRGSRAVEALLEGTPYA